MFVLMTRDCLVGCRTAESKVPITIELPDGSIKEGKAWETTPMDIAAQIAKSLAKKAIVAQVCVSC